MDPKNWGWRRRSSEKTITTSDSVDNVLNIPTGTEIQAIPVDNKPKPDLSVSTLNQKLASVLVDCQENDELELSETGKVETEVEQLRLELKDALSRLAAANENSSRLESQLEERNEQLTVLREDSKRKVHDAETSRDYLEDKLSESSKKLVAASTELLAKEMLIEDLSRCKSQAEAEFNALMCRLDSIEKENAFLKYEYCVLEKELAIRTDELEYHRQSADSSHRKHLDSLKKIAKLEGEIHQLRVLMQKRLPGSASMTKMKNEVKMLGKERSPESSSTKKLPSNKVNYLVEKLCDVEEENKSLKELVARKETELESSRALCSKTSLRLSELEATRQGMDLVKVNDDVVGNRTSSSGSWANALISELENFRIEKLNPIEIDNLAIVSVPKNEPRKTTEISFDWLQVVLNAMMEQTRISNRSLLELFEDVSIALGFMNQTESPGVKISGYLPWKSPSSKGEDNYHRSGEFSKSVMKLARLIKSFTPTKSDYFVRVFQWKSSELSVIQENVLRACSDLLDEKYDVEAFVQELADALEWILNSDSTTPKNASRDRIKRRINFTDSPGKDDLDNHSPSKLDKNSLFVDENSDQTAEMKLKSANDELEKAEQCIESLRSEVEELKEAKLALEDQMENQKAINVDLDTQLTMAKSKHNEILQKLSSLEIELDEKKRCCEDLESTCLELQLQLESAGKESPRHPNQMVTQSGWEITSASVKLAECQETIVNLGRQLKALASPKERSLFEKVLSTTNTPNALLKKSLSKRSSLRDRMLAEDDHSGPRDKGESPECTGDGKMHKNGSLSLALVPSKKQTGVGFLRRLLLRRTRGSIKKSSVDKMISLR